MDGEGVEGSSCGPGMISCPRILSKAEEIGVWPEGLLLL